MNKEELECHCLCCNVDWCDIHKEQEDIKDITNSLLDELSEEVFNLKDEYVSCDVILDIINNKRK